MTIRINNIRLSLDEDVSALKSLASNILKVSGKDIYDFKIIKESIDARRKEKINFIYSVEISLPAGEKLISQKCGNNDVSFQEIPAIPKLIYGEKKLKARPIIIGSGPAGLYAGLLLAKNGYKPIIFERGKCVAERTEAVKKFWAASTFDTECNVQFGEGGAGTFSDGKLTTRIKDTRCDIVLDEMIKSGAPEEIKYNYKPHIGTDILKTVVTNIRNNIIELGGEVHFSSKLTDVKINNGKIDSITINNTNHIDCDVLIIAIGHSARDTYEMLLRCGATLTQKPFAVGFRIEHKQSMIDESQYGIFAQHPKLRVADYRMAYQSKRYDRPCYTFCMCPGGLVVAAASEENGVVTNGMSEHARDMENANSAIVCGVKVEDFGSSSPLSGINYQRRLEELAYKHGGGDYMAPVQRVDDFLKSTITTRIGNVKPSYTRGYNFSDLNNSVPPVISAVIKEGLVDFNNKIKGFSCGDSILTAIETRTSAPVRIDRNEVLQSVNISGLYPTGEGAGYAGGIITSAVDGIRVAEEVMKLYAPIER